MNADAEDKRLLYQRYEDSWKNRFVDACERRRTDIDGTGDASVGTRTPTTGFDLPRRQTRAALRRSTGQTGLAGVAVADGQDNHPIRRIRAENRAPLSLSEPHKLLRGAPQHPGTRLLAPRTSVAVVDSAHPSLDHEAVASRENPATLRPCCGPTAMR
ncbi:MAG: hypothetical protein IPM80_16465 [Proteobacteria bacterium]|jgi:hypothetical protein|nr:hypothetical protein [Pseudomonadota bacterium]